MLAAPTIAAIYHLERITAILDTPPMANVREQFLDIEAERAPAVNLGGQGGNAPGAGGGGGAAIGPDASGGPGGPGGNVNLSGTPGTAPGAGGGGAGVVGKGAIGGEGGGGGEHVVESIEIGPETGVHHLEFRVGKGGNGGPGEDTIVNLCDKDGNVLRTVVAKGGKMGAPPYVPPPSRQPTEEDIRAGLKVTAFLAAEFVRIKDGLVTIIDGGWTWWTANTNPCRISLPLLVELQTGAIEAGTILELKFIVLDPDAFHTHEQPQLIQVPDSLVRRFPLTTLLEFSGSKSGVWLVKLMAAKSVIGEFSIEIRLPP